MFRTFSPFSFSRIEFKQVPFALVTEAITAAAMFRRQSKTKKKSISILKHNNKPKTSEFSLLIAAAAATMASTLHGKCFQWIFHRRCVCVSVMIVTQQRWNLSFRRIYSVKISKWENNLEAVKTKWKPFKFLMLITLRASLRCLTLDRYDAETRF